MQNTKKPSEVDRPLKRWVECCLICFQGIQSHLIVSGWLVFIFYAPFGFPVIPTGGKNKVQILSMNLPTVVCWIRLQERSRCGSSSLNRLNHGSFSCSALDVPRSFFYFPMEAHVSEVWSEGSLKKVRSSKGCQTKVHLQKTSVTTFERAENSAKRCWAKCKAQYLR